MARQVWVGWRFIQMCGVIGSILYFDFRSSVSFQGLD